MRSSLALLLVSLGACGDKGDAVTPDAVDARPAMPDAASGTADAPIAFPPDAPGIVEDLDMQLADFKDIPGFMMPAGRSYRVANLLGHEAEALAAASSPTGGTFPVGSLVEVNHGEVMVKRRVGFNATTHDWEYFGIAYAPDGVTPASFSVRGVEETQCFMCHSVMSSPQWDFMCDHP
jgi:hypothetical protein